MSQYKITKKRLAQIIKEEYEAAQSRTDEACATPAANRDEKKLAKDPEGKKKMKKESLDSIRTLIQKELQNL